MRTCNSRLTSLVEPSDVSSTTTDWFLTPERGDIVKNSLSQSLAVVGLVALTLIVGTCKGDDGAAGATGPAGTAGTPGPPGPPGSGATPTSIASVALPDALTIPTTATNLGSVTLTVPAPGKVLLLVSGSAVFFGDNTMADVGLGTGAGLTDLHSTRFGRQDGAGALRYTHAFSDMAVANVTAGTRTFFATGLREGTFSANGVNLGNLYLVALYVPN